MHNDEINLLSQDGEMYYIPHLFNTRESVMFYNALFHGIQWKQQKIKMFGRILDMPRLTAWYGDEGKKYSYSNVENIPLPWTETLIEIKEKVEQQAEEAFNSVLINFYRDGFDSMGWHKDDEKELGLNPVIASVSFGGTRKFKIKHVNQRELKADIELEDGSLLLMRGATQHYWSHSIPKTMAKVEPRINLTFRNIN